MKHIFKEGLPNHPTLLLLHGTGGSENDLLPIAEMIDPDANVLSVRGNINENGLSRFFKRLREGVFDEEDLVKQTDSLNDFLDQASQDYQFDREQVVAIGYSNGANIAGSLLFHYEKPLKGAILHHPMVPRRGLTLPDQNQLPVFIGAGTNDPLCPVDETKELDELLSNANAKVKVEWVDQGHQLSRQEVQSAKQWYEENLLN
ncbi:phospholipase/carboxylesterase [Pelagirhabdus alkalitolerans]|uniref:Phospholipase/carboxylesterase n=1 Tax=Pelagirhabdus alkalitolerans TaxID=1612202 RepID=A0A1G6GXF5_9BACI|nr:alpha/beta hydrolase [Pelagirhabdus alkalitolerans]SDB86692.1 phospholipase/carboxylesterase [Pelagirhabdus alkalitolerans]